MGPVQDIRILVPTDFGREAAEAIERALQLARTHPVTALHVVHIRHPGEDASPIGRRLDIRSRLQAELSTVRRSITFDVIEREAPGIADGVLATAGDHNCNLILVGTRGGGLLTEGVAEQLIERAEVDVLVVGHSSDRRWPDRRVKILVPVDFSDNARRALAMAQALAGSNPVSVLHVADDGEDVQDVRRRVSSWAEARATDITIRCGEPAHVVAHEVADEEVGLVVVGARGTRDAAGPVFSGVPERLIRSARSPVLIVH